MVLRALEYSDCVTDSPFFRETLQAHEKELEETAENIKVLTKACKRLLAAQRELSKAQRQVSDCLATFKIEPIGDVTEDEDQIIGAFKEFSSLITTVEDQRDMFLAQAESRLLTPLEKFRHEEVQATKEEKKSFEKSSVSYCKMLDTYLSTSSKRKDTQLQEADDQMEKEADDFLNNSCHYVQQLQDVQLRKTFELVEPLLGFMRDQMTFYHQGYESCNDFAEQFTQLQIKLQITQEQYEQQKEQTTELIKRVMERAKAGDTSGGTLARQGYCYLQKQRKGGFIGTTSVKHYCQFIKDEGLFVMFPYNQQQGKLSNPESFKLDSCTRRPTDSTEKRFCVDITSGDKVYTLQCLSAKDRTLWMEVLDGREPDYMMIDSMKKGGDKSGILAPASQLQFVEKCIAAVEAKGMEEVGVYRLSGVGSKAEKLMKVCIEKGKVSDKVNLLDPEWEVTTITSALKNFFRNREALLTYKLYPDFLAAAKESSANDRFRAIHKCKTMLPPFNQKILKLLVHHLHRVAEHADVNKMHGSNIGVVFGPTLMRPPEDTMASIMDIKYQHIVIEVMVQRCAEIFSDQVTSPASPAAALPSHPSSSSGPTTPQTTPHQTLRRAAPIAPGHPPPLVAPSHAPPPAPVSAAPPPPAAAAASAPGPGPGPATARRPPPNRKPEELRGRTNSEVPRPSSKPPPPPGRNLPLSGTQRPALGAGAGAGGSTGNSEDNSPEHSSRPVAPVAPTPRRRPGSVIERDPLSSTSEQPERANSPSNCSEKSLPREEPSVAAPAAPPRRSRGVRRARALYPCVAEDDNELSFTMDEIFHDVVKSDEPGWFVCTLRGRTGLVPENYIELI